MFQFFFCLFTISIYMRMHYAGLHTNISDRLLTLWACEGLWVDRLCWIPAREYNRGKLFFFFDFCFAYLFIFVHVVLLWILNHALLLDQMYNLIHFLSIIGGITIKYNDCTVFFISLFYLYLVFAWQLYVFFCCEFVWFYVLLHKCLL